MWGKFLKVGGMSENKNRVDAINALTTDTNSDAIKWTRANDNEYHHKKEKYGKLTLAAVPQQQKRTYSLTAFDAPVAAKPGAEKMKAKSADGDDVHTALESLWKAVTEDYGDEGVKFLAGFTKPK